MVAVWILFVVGIVAVIVGLIPALLETYAFIAAYILTEKELLEKKKQLRKERIKNLKAKDIEVKDNENIKIPEATEAIEEQPIEEIKEETKEEVTSTTSEETPSATEETVNASEIAKDIVNNI